MLLLRLCYVYLILALRLAKGVSQTLVSLFPIDWAIQYLTSGEQD